MLLRKKHILFLVTFFAVNISLQAQDKARVVATASIFADMAKNIAGDKVIIQSIVPIGSDPHLYSPTPRDAKMVADADLILKNGLTFEGWLSELIENSGTKAEVVLITKGLKAIESPKYKNATDPHAWMAASNGLIYIQNIKDALIRLDPANKEHYEKNYEAYRQKLVETDQYIQQLIQSIPEERRVLITSHDAFQYYGRRYGIRLEAVMGISTDVDVQTSDITRLYKVIASSGVPAIFIESTINPKLLKQIAGDNNIVIGGELYADSIGDQDSPAPSYIDMLRHNTEVIAKALKMKKKRAAHSSQEKRAAQKKDSSYWWLYGTIAFIALGGLLLTAKNLSI